MTDVNVRKSKRFKSAFESKTNQKLKGYFVYPFTSLHASAEEELPVYSTHYIYFDCLGKHCNSLSPTEFEKDPDDLDTYSAKQSGRIFYPYKPHETKELVVVNLIDVCINSRSRQQTDFYICELENGKFFYDCLGNRDIDPFFKREIDEPSKELVDYFSTPKTWIVNSVESLEIDSRLDIKKHPEKIPFVIKYFEVEQDVEFVTSNMLFQIDCLAIKDSRSTGAVPIQIRFQNGAWVNIENLDVSSAKNPICLDGEVDLSNIIGDYRKVYFKNYFNSQFKDGKVVSNFRKHYSNPLKDKNVYLANKTNDVKSMIQEMNCHVVSDIRKADFVVCKYLSDAEYPFESTFRLWTSQFIHVDQLSFWFDVWGNER